MDTAVPSFIEICAFVELPEPPIATTYQPEDGIWSGSIDTRLSKAWLVYRFKSVSVLYYRLRRTFKRNLDQFRLNLGIRLRNWGVIL